MNARSPGARPRNPHGARSDDQALTAAFAGHLSTTGTPETLRDALDDAEAWELASTLTQIARRMGWTPKP